MKSPNVKKVEMMPGFPPEDYTGTQADWMVALQEESLWNGEGWYGDVEIPENKYWEILDKCEAQ